MHQILTTHPKGNSAKVLFSSVFGPYAQDDEFGSRSINPMELYHNQVTRAQGPFSLRIFHRSWGIMLLQENISAPSTVLDFPTREKFAAELKSGNYDIVGITSIVVNIGKVREMCRMVRELSPQSKIVVGGHVTAVPGIEMMIDADHIVKGEGVSWFRRYLGDDAGAPVRHPRIASGFGHRIMGLKLPSKAGSTCATIIPSVGCPMGCNFCTTSAFFGGKGNVTHFFRTGEELFEVMDTISKESGLTSFFMMDENFLLDRPRALRVLELMREHGKTWELYVFSSANAIRKYSMEELTGLGVTWVWMGLESPLSGYAKLSGHDTLELTRELHQNGIRVLGSSIIGMEHHTPENIGDEIEYAASHETDFHQFMLYTPLPGTPLYKQMDDEGRLIDVDLADVHGQYMFNWKHAHITREQSKQFLDNAFQHDFDRNGPSLYRIAKTMLKGWLRNRNHPEARVRKRFARDGMALRTAYSGILWAMERELKRTGSESVAKVRELREEIRRELGPLCTVSAAILGRVFEYTTRREVKRQANGHTYEPETFIERKNWDKATAAAQ